MISIKIYEILIIVFFKKILGIEVNKNIRIYATKNNYPRPLTLRNGSVLAFSGYKMGTISKYSKEAEELELHIPFIEYDSSLDIKEIENDKFIMVWGKNTIIQIVYVDAKTFKITPTKLNGDFFILLLTKLIFFHLGQIRFLLHG